MMRVHTDVNNSYWREENDQLEDFKRSEGRDRERK